MRIALKSFNDQKTKRDNRIIFALCSLIFLPSINNFLNTFLQKKLHFNLVFLTPAVYIFMFFLSVFILYRYAIVKKVFLCVVFLFFIFVTLSYVLYPEIRGVIYSSPVDLVYSPVNKLFFFCLPALGGIMCLSDYGELFEKMRIWGIVTVVIGILSYYSVSFFGGETLQYMVFSYFMLLPICVCYEHARVKGSKIDLILAIIGTVCIVMCGARGACLSLILYFIFRAFCSYTRRISVKSVVKFCVLIILGMMMLLYYNEILTLVADLFESVGVNSRFIQKLTEGAILEDSARSKLNDSIWRGLKSNPLGYGLFSDRYVTGNFGEGVYTYAHNIITELLCDFGFIGGGILLLTIFLRIGKTTIVFRNRREINLLLTLLPYGVFQLFFSSSFLENTIFFIIMGLCFCAKAEKINDKQIGDSI